MTKIAGGTRPGLLFCIKLRRLAYLDWMRGIAVLIMIPCHTFNAFTQLELRKEAAYILSQFIGGMAAPLFLFLAGVTFAFQMEKLDRSGAAWHIRLRTMARRAGYIVLLAYLFRASAMFSTVFSLNLASFWKVDILNSMGVGLVLLSAVTLWPARTRPQFAAVLGLAIASATPLLRAGIPPDWGIPQIRNYLVADPSRFPLFPWSAYLAFGIATGSVLRRVREEMLERTLLWIALGGLVIAWGAQHVSNLSFSLYDSVSFWIDSPALILIRTGLMLLILGAAYVWTEYLVGPRLGWIQAFGRTSLMVYWVHVVLVYGAIGQPWKRQFSIWQTTAVTVLVIALMAGLAYARLWQKEWTAARATARDSDGPRESLKSPRVA